MARSPMLAATLQSTFLAALSSVLAQLITAYKQQTSWLIDWIPVFQFVLFTMVNTPPNFLWQEFLENTFPSNPNPNPNPAAVHDKKTDDKKATTPSSSAPAAPRLSKTNTAAKFLLDQTLGAAVNTLLFCTFMRSLRTATGHAPRVTNFTKAVDFWVQPGAVDFSRVDFNQVLAESLEEFWPLLLAGYKLWPLVSLVNFSLVKSVQVRNLVGAIAGVAWGVYICLVTST